MAGKHDQSLSELLIQGIVARRELGDEAVKAWYAALTPETREQVRQDADQLAGAWAEMFSPLTVEILLDCKAAGMTPEAAGEYCRAVLTYMSMAASNFTARSTSLVTWDNNDGKPRYTFTRQAVQMVWDYAEVNPFGLNGFMAVVNQMAAAIGRLPSRDFGRDGPVRSLKVMQK